MNVCTPRQFTSAQLQCQANPAVCWGVGAHMNRSPQSELSPADDAREGRTNTCPDGDQNVDDNNIYIDVSVNVGSEFPHHNKRRDIYTSQLHHAHKRRDLEQNKNITKQDNFLHRPLRFPLGLPFPRRSPTAESPLRVCDRRAKCYTADDVCV